MPSSRNGTGRVEVRKTYKLFIGGEFPRSESGRTYEAEGQNVTRASRKDVRDAVRVARGALSKWSGLTAHCSWKSRCPAHVGPAAVWGRQLRPA